MNRNLPHPSADNEDCGELPARLPDAVLAALRQQDSVSARDATGTAAEVQAAEVHAMDAADRAVLAEAQAYFAARDAEPLNAGALNPAAPVSPAASAASAATVGPAATTAPASIRPRRTSDSRAGMPRQKDRTARHRAGRATRRRRFAAVVSAAAVVLIAAVLVQPVLVGPGDPDDIDGSGQVDILDAFALARMRASGRAVSDARIDALTARVVALEPPGSAR